MEGTRRGPRGLALAAALLVAGATACDDAPTRPEEGELSRDEAAFLAAETEAAVGLALGRAAAEPGAARPLSFPPRAGYPESFPRP